MPSASHRNGEELANQHLVLAVVRFLAFPRSFARGLVLLPAVELALLVAEVRPSVAGAAEELASQASFGFAREAGWNGH